MGLQQQLRLLVLALVVVCSAAMYGAAAAPAPPAPCGTLDLSSPLTQHCFPEDGE